MPTAARAGALKDGRRPPPQAARSVLERPEHDAPIKNGGRRTIALASHNGIYGLLNGALMGGAALAHPTGWSGWLDVVRMTV